MYQHSLLQHILIIDGRAYYNNITQMYKQSQEPESPPSPSPQSDSQPACDYGSFQYWQQRYKRAKGQRFDWLQSYQNIKHLIVEQFGPHNKDLQILNIGCGNGQIQDHLYEDGYKKIHNNDISKQVIQQMQQIRVQKNQQSMIYQVMDVRQMAYPSSYFDIVIDKSTIDALLCSDCPYINTSKMLQEVERVLKKDGLYLIVSYAPPESRMKHLERENVSFQVKVRELVRFSQEGNKLIHYAYVCKNRKQEEEEGQQEQENQEQYQGGNQGQKDQKIEQKGKDKKNKGKKTAEWKKQFYEKLKKQQIQFYGES